jgi:hypothetical protein
VRENDDAEEALALRASGSCQKQVARTPEQSGSGLLEIGFGHAGMPFCPSGCRDDAGTVLVMLERSGGAGNDPYVLGSGAL